MLFTIAGISFKPDKNNPQFIEEMQIRNPNISDMGEYINAHTKIRVSCNQCGCSFLITPNSLLNGHGCIECNLIHGNGNRRKRTL